MNVIAKARVTYALNGYGDLTLTDTALVWNKSATSFLAFGALNALTTDFEPIPLTEIAEVSTYTYVGSGGIKIIDNRGKEYKFSFKKKKDFVFFRDYLTQKASSL